jgi:hypothetical protein
MISTRLRTVRRAGTTLAAVALSAIVAGAQTRPLLYSLVPAPQDDARTTVYTDLDYGHRLFPSLGAEQLEQRIGLQTSLNSRFTLVAQAGWAPNDAATANNVSGQAELLANLKNAGSRVILAAGVGAMEDYHGKTVALGRLVAGYRWSRTLAVANLRLEHAFVNSSDTDARRDAVDVITTLGVMRDVASNVRVGVESVAEDLEGMFEPNEAEGGAKVMIGPSLGFGRRNSHWTIQFTGGPIFHVTRSSVPDPLSGAPRALGANGYVIRSALGYQW